jgi:hypothetical protein
VTDVNDRAYDTDLLDTLSKRVVVGDGEGCNEILRRNYLQAGADPVETKYVRLQSG